MNIKNIVTIAFIVSNWTLIFSNNNINTSFRESNNPADSTIHFDSVAIEKFTRYLKFIENYVYHDSLINIPGSIASLERITQIHSKSSGGYFGKEDPSIEDYINWKNWFELNKSKLCWDIKERMVVLCE